MRLKFRATTVGLALSATAMVGGAAVIWAQQPPPPSQVENQVRASLRRVAERTGILVEPLVAQDMARNAVIFSGNLCFAPPPGESESCGATLGTPAVIDEIVAAYLAELVQQRPVEIETLASRLARAVDRDIRDAGWPNKEPNEIALVVVPEPLRASAVALQGASGPIALGRGARFLLMRPGRRTLLFGRGDAASRQTVTAGLRGRVALQTGPAGSVSASTSSSFGRVDAPDLSCRGERQPSYTGPLTFFNWGRGRHAESEAERSANLTAFAIQPAVEIRIAEETAGTCRGDCITGLSIAFARAIAAWRGGCERCGGNMLAVIKIGRNVWLDVRAADRLRAFTTRPLTANDLSLSKPIASEIQRTFAGQNGAASVSYDQVDDDPALRAQVCATASLPVPWLAPLKAVLCRTGGATFGPLRPTLVLRNNRTSCGSAEDFIACGVPGGRIELVLAGSRYSIPLPNGTHAAIGPADGEPIALRGVLIHEVGHWFSVPHSETAGTDAVLDVMSQTYDPKRLCLSAASKIMLNNAADRRWTYAVRDQMGLRRGRARR